MLKIAEIMTYYENNGYYTIEDKKELKRYIRKAIDIVNILTFEQANSENLTAYQLQKVEECICELADYVYINSDYFDSAVSSFSLNGASVTFDRSTSVTTVSGIPIPSLLYGKLSSTGLCCGAI